jgi:hypothetical protein
MTLKLTATSLPAVARVAARLTSGRWTDDVTHGWWMRTLRAQARATVFGTHDSWSLSRHPGFEKAGVECNVHLEIQGDEKGGYHLVKSPEGFFTADDWYMTIGEAQRSALELFGVDPDRWVED